MGSSPLARGTPAGCPPPGVQGGGVGGLIPARAGNTGVRFGVLMGAWAHPRSRGEHATGKGRSPWFWGSSPLARGTRVRPRPRYALPQSRAHPRSRGEHIPNVLIGGKNEGSSPLARGTLQPGIQRAKVAGLIPARAGNTLTSSSKADTFRAHPRSRGEHRLKAAERAWELGSSPLARGTHSLTSGQCSCPGLIPARAGNTYRMS